MSLGGIFNSTFSYMVSIFCKSFILSKIIFEFLFSSSVTFALKYIFCIPQHWMDESDGSGDSILKHKPLWATYASKRGKEKKKKTEKKQSDLHRTYGTRVIPV